MEDSSISQEIPADLLDPLPFQEIPAELIPEIRKRLPVKSLMQFKAVSRGWLSIITNPSFARAYRGGMRGLCAYGTPKFDTLLPEMDFIRLNLDDGIATKLIVDHGDKKLGYTNLVNGLICFYSGNDSWLYNIATRETLQLPVSVNESKDSCYYFGFDPVSKLHKLLKICTVYEGWPARVPDDTVFGRFCFLKCEILTIGEDPSWRTVDSLPPAKITYECSCIDGALYWLDPSIYRGGRRIVAFDLSEEKFRPFIDIPPNFSEISLAKFGPGLALFTQIRSPGSDSPKYAISYYTNNAWSPPLEYPHPYPGYNQRWSFPDLVPQGILPNGKVVLYVLPISLGSAALNLFDPIEGQFQEIKVTTTKRNILDGLSFYYYEENIMPLRPLNSCP